MSEAKEIAQTKLNDAKSDIEAKYDEFAKGLKQESEALRVSLSAQMPLFQESLKAKVSSI
jgi:F-type H+-transporting ATPase subunit b